MSEEKDTQNTNIEDAEIKVPKRILLVHVVKEDGTPVEGGTQFILENNKLTPEQALGFIRAFSAAKLPDGRTLVVTAHLADGEKWTETYSAGPCEDYNEEVGLNFCKSKIIHKVWKYLSALYATATYIPKEDDLPQNLVEEGVEPEEFNGPELVK